MTDISLPSVLGRSVSVCAALVLLALLLPGLGHALPPNFSSEIFIGSGMIFPTAMEFLPDGTMLITEFSGKILAVPPGMTQINATPVLQLTNIFRDQVNLGGERGLVGITADPNFSTNHYIYIFYTAQTPQRDRVSRFTMTGSTASLASELVVWQGTQNSTTTDHHGGWVAFGPDGKLYISTGDNAVPPNCQLLTSDFGKILRINSDGTVPTDNPFYDGAGPNIDSIWARGLRNPYRFSFDSLTGRMYIGDVGLNTTEEVNLGIAGANYGWPVCEGPCSNAGMTNPIHSYPHNGTDSAVTAGFVYRGTQFPAQYQGVFFFGDYAKKWIRYLTLDSNGLSTGVSFFEPTDGTSNGPYGNPVCFRKGPDGAIYYVDIGLTFTGIVSAPAIRRIRYVTGDQPPVVVSNATPTAGIPPLTVAFSSAGSFDPEGQPLTYAWTFGDGNTSTAANPLHTYTASGPYQARLTVSDASNSTLGTPLLIQVGWPPVPIITSPVSSSTFRGSQTIAFAGGATDPNDGVLPASALSWTILFHHDTHVHPAAGPLPGIASGSFVAPSSGHDFSGNTSYEIILTAVNSTGLQAGTSVFIYPQKVNLSFSSVPSGLSLNLDGIPYTTPFVKDALINFQYSLQAPNQGLGTTQYTFASWSDGGAQTHSYVVPAANQALSATFQTTGTSGLSAGWALDETSGTTADDASGNNHPGTLVNNPTRTPNGKSGGGLVLNGTSNYVQVNNPGLPTGDFTWMLWLNRTNNQAFQTLIEAQGSTVAEMEMNLQSGKISVWSSGASRLTSSGTITPNTWVHVALTRLGGLYRVYINGVADSATGTDTRTFSFGTCALLIGIDADSGCTGSLNGYLSATIDEVRVYNRALSAPEIQSAMNSSLGAPPSDTTPPVRSNLQPTGTLAPGSVQATLSLVTDENATCRYSLTPSTAYAAMSLLFASTGGTTHSTVVTGLSNGGSYSHYVRCQDSAGNPNPDDAVISFSVSLPDATPPQVTITSPVNGALVSGTVPVNATASDTNGVTKVEFYVDGVLFASDTSSPFSVPLNTTTLANGSRVLTAKAYDPTGNIGVSGAVAVTVSNAVATPTITPNGGTFGVSVTVTLATTTSGAAIRYTTDGTTPGLGSLLYSAPFALSTGTTMVRAIALRADLNDSAVAQATFVVTSTPPVTGLVDGFSFNEGAGLQVQDVSTNANVGALVNSVSWNTQGKYSNALSFNGANGYVQVNSPDLPTGNFTWEAWIKQTQRTSFQGIMMARDGIGPEININSSGRIVIYSSGTLRLTTTAATAIPLNIWTHIALTRSGSALRFFINGVQNSATGSDAAVYNFSTCPLLIGVDSDSGCNGKLNGYFKGLIDEVRVYNRALTQAEVQQDMATPIVP